MNSTEKKYWCSPGGGKRGITGFSTKREEGKRKGTKRIWDIEKKETYMFPL